MDEPLENLYFNWLYSQVSDAYPPALYRTSLLGELHKIEYVWLIIGDDNRYEDGLELRIEFLDKNEFEYDSYFLDEACSVLEMLIAFSRRASFQTEESPREWFWIMVDNLGLLELDDSVDTNCKSLKEIVSVFINRTYGSSGNGGLFPLRHTINNQRKVEIWYQFSEYLHELKNT